MMEAEIEVKIQKDVRRATRYGIQADSKSWRNKEMDHLLEPSEGTNLIDTSSFLFYFILFTSFCLNSS